MFYGKPCNCHRRTYNVICTFQLCLTHYMIYFSPLLTPDKLALVCGEGQTVSLAQLPQLGANMLKVSQNIKYSSQTIRGYKYA